MFFTLSLYLALAICVLGLAYKVKSWLTTSIRKGDEQYSPGRRAAAAVSGLLRVIFSPRIGPFLWALVADGLLQRRSLRHSFTAWLAHILVFFGFMGLLLLHAFGEQITISLFPDYYPTLDPWLFLRDFMGIMVLVGVGLIIYRRITLPGLRVTTQARDRIVICLLASILFSGFALQAVKITSANEFQAMVEEYAGIDDPQEIKALRSVWAADYGVVFPAGQTSTDPEVLERGRELNQDSCIDCHSPAQRAFASYALSCILRPIALGLDKVHAVDILYYLHFLVCFAGLAFLPFSKFIHLITAPILLAVNAATDHKTMNPAALAALRAMELDACTHCGTCTVHCSVAVVMHQVHNRNILPSEKLQSLALMARGHNGDRAQLAVIREGAYMCTNCYRCTRLCPVGIDLDDLWKGLKEDLAQDGLGMPLQEVAQNAQKAAEPSRQQQQVKVSMGGFQHGLKHSAQANTFSECYACKECTNACPLVFQYEDPIKHLDLLPHQIMHALKLGMKEEAMGARMVWNCLTCYECQQACPNLVQVTDIFYELRYMAAQKASGMEA